MNKDVLDIIASQADVPVEMLHEGTDLMSLAIDSLDSLQIIQRIEEKLGIIIDSKDVINLNTVGDVLKLTASYMRVQV